MDEPLHLGVIVVEHQNKTYTLVDICTICGVSDSQIIELVSFGIVEPQGTSADRWRFSERSLDRTKKALRLQRDLHLENQGLALSLDLLDEIDRLRATLASLHWDNHIK